MTWYIICSLYFRPASVRAAIGAVGAVSGSKLNKNEGLYGKGVGRHEA